MAPGMKQSPLIRKRHQPKLTQGFPKIPQKMRWQANTIPRPQTQPQPENRTPLPLILKTAGSLRRELVLVNDNVRDIDELVAGIDFPEGASGTLEVIILDTGRDGIEQVSEILSTRDELDAIHIFTHGRDGQLALGSDWLDSDDLQENSDALAAWGESLSEDGDILLYGCSIAAGDTGQDFVDSLAGLTSADVSASDDPTGHDALGGDWDLEYTAGVIETVHPVSAAVQQNWDQLMAATIADDFNTDTFGGNTGSVSWNNDWQEIGESDGPDDGSVSVFANGDFSSEHGLTIWREHGVWREANLSGAASATLSFDWGCFIMLMLETR